LDQCHQRHDAPGRIDDVKVHPAGSIVFANSFTASMIRCQTATLAVSPAVRELNLLV
jgi:hypothetical protein